MKHPISEVHYKGLHNFEQHEYSSLLALYLLTACTSVHPLVLCLYLQTYFP